MDSSLVLDVSGLPFDQVYTCGNGSMINMRELLGAHEMAVGALSDAGLAKKTESFGFAMTEPGRLWSSLGPRWDDPADFVWFVGGWGPEGERDRYIANAVRKLRALLRYSYQRRPSFSEGSKSTLDLRFRRWRGFQRAVSSVSDDGTFPWGDYPWGGAAIENYGSLEFIGAGSSLTEMQDNSVVKLILGSLAERVVDANGLLPDN